MGKTSDTGLSRLIQTYVCTWCSLGDLLRSRIYTTMLGKHKHGMWVVAVFVSCCCLFTSLQPVISGCLLDGEEAAALHALKASLLHSDINPPSSWVEGNDCCSWEGVGCSNATSSSSSSSSTTIDTTNISRRVVEALHLSWFASPYAYPLKQWHLNLSVFKVFHELRHLDVSGNNFRTSLESLDIAGLRKLEHLNLSNNWFEGGRGIPTSWTSLSSLRFLDLSGNRISGPFPSVLTRLTKLIHLDLRGNHLNGSLPAQDITRLRKLKHLGLGSNMFEGGIPASWTSLSSLRFLDLSSNNLRGPFPAALTRLSKLVYLDLRWNKLNGSLTVQDMTGMRKLEDLDLSFNQFEGEVPVSWTALSSLQYLNLNFNKLRGPGNNGCPIMTIQLCRSNVRVITLSQ